MNKLCTETAEMKNKSTVNSM